MEGQSDHRSERHEPLVTFNPLPEENFIGQSGLQAGAVPADTYNAGMLWRYSSVKNGNVLDGILTPKGDKTLDDKQVS
jgi:hypothetical protein